MFPLSPPSLPPYHPTSPTLDTPCCIKHITHLSPEFWFEGQTSAGSDKPNVAQLTPPPLPPYYLPASPTLDTPRCIKHSTHLSPEFWFEGQTSAGSDKPNVAQLTLIKVIATDPLHHQTWDLAQLLKKQKTMELKILFLKLTNNGTQNIVFKIN